MSSFTLHVVLLKSKPNQLFFLRPKPTIPTYGRLKMIVTQSLSVLNLEKAALYLILSLCERGGERVWCLCMGNSLKYITIFHTAPTINLATYGGKTVLCMFILDSNFWDIVYSIKGSVSRDFSPSCGDQQCSNQTISSTLLWFRILF